MLLLTLVTILSFILSLSTKLLADSFLSERIAIIGQFVGLVPTENPGVAFGMTFGGLQFLFIIVAFIAVIVVALRSTRTNISQIGFGLIIGGALGNIADRLSDGLVTDFFQVGAFPVFNVADSCITVGAGLLIVEALVLGLERRKKG